MINIDVKSGVPIYEQIVEGIKNLIIKNVLKGDEKIPSVRELGRKLTINPNTIQKAYRELEYQGYIYTVIGRGNFVSNQSEKPNGKKVTELIDQAVKIIEELRYLGIDKREVEDLISEIYVNEAGE